MCSRGGSGPGASWPSLTRKKDNGHRSSGTGSSIYSFGFLSSCSPHKLFACLQSQLSSSSGNFFFPAFIILRTPGLQCATTCLHHISSLIHSSIPSDDPSSSSHPSARPRYDLYGFYSISFSCNHLRRQQFFFLPHCIFHTHACMDLSHTHTRLPHFCICFLVTSGLDSSITLFYHTLRPFLRTCMHCLHTLSYTPFFLHT